MKTYKDEDGFDIETYVVEFYDKDKIVERAVIQKKSAGGGLMPPGRPGGDLDTPDYDDGFSELSVTVSAGGIKDMSIKGDEEQLASVYLELIKGIENEDVDLFEKMDNAEFCITVDKYDGYLLPDKYYELTDIAESNNFGVATRLENLILDDKSIKALNSIDILKEGMQGKNPLREESPSINELLNKKASAVDVSGQAPKREATKFKM